MHRVNAELKRTQNKPKRFKQPYFNATAAQEQTLSLLTCEEGYKGELGIQVKRHSVWMPRLGTCIASTAHILTLRARCAAPFASHTFHSCFYLCRAREKNTRPPNEHSVDNPNVLTKQPTRTQCVSVR